MGFQSSKNARQWHFIRAEGPSNGSWRSRSALPPTCRSRRALTCQSRRALKPLRAESTVVPLLSSGTESSSTYCLWMIGARIQFFVMGCPEQVQYTLMDGHVFKEAWFSTSCSLFRSLLSFPLIFLHFPTSPCPALPSLVKSIKYCLQQIIFHAVCAIIKRMVRDPGLSTQTSSSFLADNACGRKGSSTLGLCDIWYISIPSTKRRA